MCACVELLKAKSRNTPSPCLCAMAKASQSGKARVSPNVAAIQHYRNTSSGVPIKIMTLGLLSLTTWFAYDLWSKKKFPHQHGADLRDLFRER